MPDHKQFHAEHPVFMVRKQADGSLALEERTFHFNFAPGLSPTQKKKNIIALQAVAKKEAGLKNILEISSKSEDEIGRKLGAFSLTLTIKEGEYFLESIFQGSKILKNPVTDKQEGPFPNIFKEAAHNARKQIEGYQEENKLDIYGYYLDKVHYPSGPGSVFYDWLYLRALIQHETWIKEDLHGHYDAYTDIEYNPKSRIACQARSFAIAQILISRQELHKAANDFKYFKLIYDQEKW